MNQIAIYFDGGCRPTNPGNKYGSYEVIVRGIPGAPKFKDTFELGWGTNNEAEFESLIKALELVESFRLPGDSLSIYTDSAILRNRVNGRNKTNKTEPQRRMFALTERVHALLAHFADWEIEWRGRETNVARFGH